MYFLDILQKCKELSGFELYAYSLMGNHVHLLIGIKNEPIDKVMRRINTRYVYWFNLNNDRVGHLLQDRYKSEAVDDDNYFLTVLRYIHQNPLKSGLCKKLKDYRWSSYSDYKDKNKNGITDIQFALDIVGHQELISFFEWENEDKCLEDDYEAPRKPNEVREIFYRITACKSAEQFQEYNQSMQRDLILKCRKEKISIRKLSDLTGLSYGILRKFKEDK